MIDRIYLTIAFFVAFFAIFIGPAGTLGPPAASVAYTGFVVIIAAVLWKIGGGKAEEGLVRGSPRFLPGVLLISGPLVLLLGASVTGHPTGERPGLFLLNTTALLVGVSVVLIGYAILSARLWEAGQRPLATLGIVGFAIGFVIFAANMLFRYAVIASGAAGGFVVADKVVFPMLGEIPFPLPSDPSWLVFTYVWVTLRRAASGLISSLVPAAYGAALARAGWIGRTGGSVFVVLGLALALVMGAGWIVLGNPVVNFLLFFLGVPFMTVVLP